MENESNNVPRRGRISEIFKKNLNGKFKKLLEYVINDNELDIQLRDNYFNIYYEGGCILKLSPSSWSFDKFYFYPEVIKAYENEKDGVKIPKTYVEEVCDGKENTRKQIKKGYYYPIEHEAKEIMGKLEEKHDELMSQLDEKDYDGFFTEAKIRVKQFVDDKGREERRDQHHIAISNRGITADNDLVVIDIESAVSKKKSYNEAEKVPKFDIIAIDKEGQLYAIELKSNREADKKDSAQNVEGHHKDFEKTIGSNSNENDFADEMSEMVKEKVNLGILPADTPTVKLINPKFAIAFAGSDEKERQKFYEEHPGYTHIYVGNDNYHLTFKERD